MDDKSEEIAAVMREIQDRVREKYPLNAAGTPNIALADLMRVIHARDRAESKVAAIGIVNPRAGGLVNGAIQAVKRTVARGLNWFIRDQIEFNRAAVDCVQALLDSVNDTNRAIAALAAQMESRFEALRTDMSRQAEEARQLTDIRLHWNEWRQEWERKLSINEIQFLRNAADLQTAFQHRVTLMEGNLREMTASQHRDFTVALDKARIEIQDRLWRDMENVRGQFEKLIHNELRVMRQRVSATPIANAPSAADIAAEPALDYLRFADRYRGTEEHVRRSLARYAAAFQGCSAVLDAGCGRGEFLEAMRDAGVPAKGIDSSAEFAALCLSKGLAVERADLFAYLRTCESASFDGLFCSQVVEHLPAHRIPELIQLAADVLQPGGKIVIETPNPECLAIFATHFYLDPTHNRPVPAPLLVFYLEENGFGRIHVDYVNPAAETLSGLDELPARFRESFFGSLDYAISAVKL
ncbi:MAG: class I SAM-dependent methyltransferase [Candidatus Solibacter usitatus]|nr:class I SAM-dependent methyltransferase [Candidatus Solibacter usitatus]